MSLDKMSQITPRSINMPFIIRSISVVISVKPIPF